MSQLEPSHRLAARAMAAALLLLGLVVVARPATAKPMFTTLDDVFAESPRIVVATYLGPGDATVAPNESATHRIEVEALLKGDGALGEREVKRATDGAPLLAPGARVVVFLDAESRWRFVAIPQDATVPLEQTWFRVDGFYDYNAYLVAPSILDWHQLEERASGARKLSGYRFEGPLRFIDPAARGLVDASDLVLDVTLDGRGESGKVMGMPAAAGLASQPELTLSSGSAPDLTLTWSRNSARPLAAEAQITGYDATRRVYSVVITPSAPALFTRATFDTYLADAEASAPVWMADVALEAGGGVLSAAPPASRGVEVLQWDARAAETLGLSATERVTLKHFMYAPRRELAFALDDGDTMTISCDPPEPPLALVRERGAGTQLYQELLLLGEDGLRCSVTRTQASGGAPLTRAAVMTVRPDPALRH